MVGPLRGWGANPPPPTTTKQKKILSINGENSPGSCAIKMLFYEVRHFREKGGFLYVKSLSVDIFRQKEKNCQNPFKANLRQKK